MSDTNRDVVYREVLREVYFVVPETETLRSSAPKGLRRLRTL